MHGHLNVKLVKNVPLPSVGFSCMHMNRPSPVFNNYVIIMLYLCYIYVIIMLYLCYIYVIFML